MHEYDELTYGKTINDLREELEYQLTNYPSHKSLIQYLDYCIKRLERECVKVVYWRY